MKGPACGCQQAKAKQQAFLSISKVPQRKKFYYFEKIFRFKFPSSGIGADRQQMAKKSAKFCGGGDVLCQSAGENFWGCSVMTYVFTGCRFEQLNSRLIFNVGDIGSDILHQTTKSMFVSATLGAFHVGCGFSAKRCSTKPSASGSEKSLPLFYFSGVLHYDRWLYEAVLEYNFQFYELGQCPISPLRTGWHWKS